MSLGLVAQGVWGLVSPLAVYASSMAALEEAFKINSELPLVRCAGAWLNMLSTRNWQEARRGFDEILNHAPSCTHGINGRGLLSVAEGCLNEASELFIQAAQQSPLSSASMALCCWSEYLMGESAHALDRTDGIRATGQPGPFLDAVEALTTIQLGGPQLKVDRVEALAAGSSPHDVLQGVLGYAYALNNQGRKARELLESMTVRAMGRESREPYAIALILIGMNEGREAVNYLEQSYRNGSIWSLGFRSDPILDGLRNDQRYGHFLTKLSYPEPMKGDACRRAAHLECPVTFLQAAVGETGMSQEVP
jgi:hypothetical protein